MKKAINIVLAALMMFAIGACAGKKSQVGSTADKSATEKTVKIGNQIWMSENLNDASKGGKCYENKPENCKKYGRLYTWKEATKACPKGWHLPSNEEWQTLVDFAGGNEIAGKKLKAKIGWEEGNGTDEYGFSALPGGFCTPDGSFLIVGGLGFWWSATELSTVSAYGWDMYYVNSGVNENYNGKSYLLSVRCVKD
ncbi:MAG: fibrobacter succinogenes major paralogous domain-containing protein [Fibromonadales bacterium]|nr:fibrobacter succinogenes major paralogous domain-containing protein [Fibromonadales bacterium]